MKLLLSVHTWLNKYVWPFNRLSQLNANLLTTQQQLHIARSDLQQVLTFAAKNSISLKAVSTKDPRAPYVVTYFNKHEVNFAGLTQPGGVRDIVAKTFVLEPNVMSMVNDGSDLSLLSDDSKAELLEYIADSLLRRVAEGFTQEVVLKIKGDLFNENRTSGLL